MLTVCTGSLLEILAHGAELKIELPVQLVSVIVY